MEETKEMNNFKENVKKGPGPKLTCKKVPGPKLKNSRNHAYSTCCDYYCPFNISSNINFNVNRK